MKKYFQLIRSQWIELVLTAGAVLAATVILAAPAIYNGFPLVFADTIDYLAAALKFSPPYYRQFGYGIFIAMTSLKGTSLWLVVLAQSFILSALIFSVVRRFIKNKPYFFHVVIVLLLVLFTGVGWFSSQLMPDILTAMMILIIYIFFTARLQWFHYLFLLPLFLIILMSHSANFLIAMLVLVTVAAYFLLRKKKLPDFKTYAVKFLVLFFVSIFATGLLSYINEKTFGRWAVNPGSHVFLMARLDESGILKDFLLQNCRSHQYTLCSFQDQLPTDANNFMWGPNTPHKLYGWEAVRPEYEEIIGKAFSTPAYWGTFISDSAYRVALLFSHNGLDSFGAYNLDSPEGSSIYALIQNYAPQELSQFMAAQQFTYNLKLPATVSTIYFPVVILSILFIIYFFRKYKIPNELKFFALIIVLGVVYNLIVMGSLSGSFDRYNSRVIWLLPFLVLILMFSKKSKKQE